MKHTIDNSGTSCRPRNTDRKGTVKIKRIYGSIFYIKGNDKTPPLLYLEDVSLESQPENVHMIVMTNCLIKTKTLILGSGFYLSKTLKPNTTTKHLRDRMGDKFTVEFTMDQLDGVVSFNHRSCEICGGLPLKMCARCNVAKYCSNECQKAHWNDHKKKCKKEGYCTTSDDLRVTIKDIPTIENILYGTQKSK